MATSQNPNTRRRRPHVGDRSATGAANPPGTDPTPDSTTEHSSGHPNARGTLPMAHLSPTTATAGEPTPPVGDGAPQPAPHHQAATLPREVDDPEIDAALDAVVADAPPLPFEVRARLAWLLRGRHHDARRDRAA